jgi:hypothetical protein
MERSTLPSFADLKAAADRDRTGSALNIERTGALVELPSESMMRIFARTLRVRPRHQPVLHFAQYRGPVVESDSFHSESLAARAASEQPLSPDTPTPDDLELETQAQQTLRTFLGDLKPPRRF